MRWVVVAALGLAACRGETKPAPPPSVQISVTWPGAMPGQVDREIVPHLEAALASLQGITELRARATVEHATIEVIGAVDVEAIRAALTAVRAELPAGAEPPVIERPDPAATPVMVAFAEGRAAAGEGGEGVRELAQTAGLRVVEACGGAADEVVVTLDPARLAAFDRSVVEVAAAIEQGNAEVPAGRVADDGRGRTVRAVGRHDQVDDLGQLAIAPGALLRDVATIHRAPGEGCRATLDGKPAAIAVVERTRGAALPGGRVLDGPAVEAVLTVDAAQVGKLTAAAHAAIMPPRWFVTRFDPDLDRLTISIGLARGVRGADVATAIDHATASMGLAAPARWTGTDLTVASAIVRGPDARDAAPHLAAELRATAGVAGAGCTPCSTHATQTLHVHDTRLAAIGARAADVTRLAAIARGGLVLGVDPPVRLAVADDVDFATLLVRTDSAGLVPVGDFLTIADADLPAEFLRIDREPAVELWARAAPGTSMAALRKLLAAKSR